MVLASLGFTSGCVECVEEIVSDADWTPKQAVNGTTLENELNRPLGWNGTLSRSTVQRGRAGGSFGKAVDAGAFGDGDVFGRARSGGGYESECG
jgi:hypothetical protein